MLCWIKSRVYIVPSDSTQVARQASLVVLTTTELHCIGLGEVRSFANLVGL